MWALGTGPWHIDDPTRVCGINHSWQLLAVAVDGARLMVMSSSKHTGPPDEAVRGLEGKRLCSGSPRVQLHPTEPLWMCHAERSWGDLAALESAAAHGSGTVGQRRRNHSP